MAAPMLLHPLLDTPSSGATAHFDAVGSAGTASTIPSSFT